MQPRGAEPVHAKRIACTPSAASQRTDLELARQDNDIARRDARLKTLLRERLCEQLEAESTQSLRHRVDELSEVNSRIHSENIHLSDEVIARRARLIRSAPPAHIAP
jgi:hypothetical protein